MRFVTEDLYEPTIALMDCGFTPFGGWGEVGWGWGEACLAPTDDGEFAVIRSWIIMIPWT